MNVRTPSIAMGDIVLGHARIGDVDVAYLQFPSARDRHSHWFLGAGPEGVNLATPLADGPIVPGQPKAAPGQIRAHLATLVGHVPPAMAARAFDHGPWGSTGRVKRFLDWLAENGLDFRGDEEERATARARDAIHPVTSRLGRRVQLAAAYLGALHKNNRLMPGPAPDRDATLARILTLTAAELAGLGGIGTDSLLRAVIELPDLRLDRPAKEVLASALGALGVPLAAARRFPPGVATSSACVRAMRSLPIDWIPKPEATKDWYRLAEFAGMLQECRVDERRWQTLLAPAKGDWPGFAPRCVRAAFGRNLEVDFMALAATLRNADDVEREFSAFLSSLAVGDHVADPETVRGIAQAAVAGDRSLTGILENSRLWHEGFGNRAAKGRIWEPVLPTWTDPASGIEVLPLTSSDALVDEGDTMLHCVGGEAFVRDSLQGRTRIVSLRRDGDRLTTAEISLLPPAPGGPDEGIVQHFGPCNSEPAPAPIRVLRDYLALESVVAARTASGGSTPRVDVDDYRREEMSPETTLDGWRRFLTGRWRNASLAEFRQAVAGDEPEPSLPGLG